MAAWQSEAPDITRVLEALAWQSEQEAWSEDRYIPHAATYLRGRRWEDPKPAARPVVSAKEARGAAAIERLLAAGEAHKGGVK